MTNLSCNTSSADWASALYNHSVAAAAWEAVVEHEPCSARDQIAQTLRDAKNGVYSVPAPSLSAFVQKLEICWGEGLFDEDYEAACRQMIIGDLRRLERALAGIEEMINTGRSAQQAGRLADQWRAALAKHEEYERLLVEGPSSRWGTYSASDIVDLIDAAAGELLSLPAPSLHGVVRKLQLLWEHDMYDPIDGPACVYLLGDLHRFAAEAAGASAQPHEGQCR